MRATYEAGMTLSAVEALRDGRQTFTAEQAAHLMHLSYEAGRSDNARDDLFELWASWADRAFVRATYESRVAARSAEMAALVADRPVYVGGPVEWGPEVTG